MANSETETSQKDSLSRGFFHSLLTLFHAFLGAAVAINGVIMVRNLLQEVASDATSGGRLVVLIAAASLCFAFALLQLLTSVLYFIRGNWSE